MSATTVTGRSDGPGVCAGPSSDPQSPPRSACRPWSAPGVGRHRRHHRRRHRHQHHQRDEHEQRLDQQHGDHADAVERHRLVARHLERFLDGDREHRLGPVEHPRPAGRHRPGDADAGPGWADSYLAKVDDAANRFREDSEISRLVGRTGPVTLSPTLTHLMTEALAAAKLTDGDVDPTVGGAVQVTATCCSTTAACCGRRSWSTRWATPTWTTTCSSRAASSSWPITAATRRTTSTSASS